MKKIKQKLSLRSSGREAKDSNEGYDLTASSTRLSGSTYSESKTGGQAKQESGPWGLKELFPGRDPVVE